MQFHFTPTYSSWLNQVEIWFSKIEREIIARGIFTSVVPDLPRKLRRYINAHSANARPQKIFIHGWAVLSSGENYHPMPAFALAS